ncbi:MAG: substrate-binding domain-containing protein [Thermofilaceae archaeon]
MVKRGYLLLLTGLLIGLLCGVLMSRVYGYRVALSTSGAPERIELVFLFTSEKEAWINAIKPLFEKHFREKYGIELELKLYVTGSHETVNLILSGSVKPDVWSPASSIWIPYLEEKWKKMHGNDIVGEWYPIALSPLVLAGWGDLVARYGVRGFADLYMLAKAGVDFKYGHTDPMLSNSGPMALLLQFCEAVNKTPDQLTIDDIRNPKTLEIVKTIESKAVFYGKSTGFFGEWAVENGPQAISFFAVYENVVISTAAKARAKWGTGLVAVYPRIGVLYSDHPLVMIDAEWVDPWKKLAARELLLFLLQPEVQELAQRFGFRPVNPLVHLNESIFNKDNGVLGEIKARALKPPRGDVLEAILEVWVEVRNPGV